MPSYGSGIVVEKQLGPAAPQAVCQPQTAVPNQPLQLNGTAAQGPTIVLDTARRLLVTSTDASPHTITLTGTNSQGSLTFEKLSLPGGGSTQSYFDYATITSVVPDGLPWSGTITIGTNAVGSTAPQILAHYMAIFVVGFDVTVEGGSTCSIECTRDIPFALPQIYVPDYKIIPPEVHWFPWPTMADMTADTISDVDSPINAWKLTVTAGTGLCVARAIPVGLRT